LKTAFKQKYTFSALANDIHEVLDFLAIGKSHFVGISMGTILIRQLAEMYPERVQSDSRRGYPKNEFPLRY
jgi:pimeloyl-ACP methyl ester carboxylesterase